MKAKWPEFGYAHVEFHRALRSLSYAKEKCSGVENVLKQCDHRQRV